MEKIRPAIAADLPDLINLVNTVFITTDKKSVLMEEKFPIFLGEQNLDHLFILTDGGKPVSHVGYYPSYVLIEGASIHVGSIGSVCTHADYRGRGLASVILDEVEANARQKGIEVLLISGERSLYIRRKAIQAGRFIEANLENIQPEQASQEIAIELREYQPGDSRELAAIYGREPVRFYRSLDEFEVLLAAGLQTFYDLDNKAYVVLDGKTIRAYFSMSWKDGSGQANEFAGDRRLLSLAFRKVMARENLRQLSIPMPASDPLASMLQGPGITQKPSTQMGTVKILNAVKLMESLRPYFLQHVPASILDALQWCEQDGQVSLNCGGDCLVFDDPTQLTRLIFGFEEPAAMSGAIAAFLARHPETSQFASDALPVPMPWAGNWNFI